jgi:two-component system response regulator RegA
MRPNQPPTWVEAREQSDGTDRGAVGGAAVERVVLACCPCLARESLVADLQRLGHRVLCATSVRATLELARVELPTRIGLELWLEHAMTLDVIQPLRAAAPCARIVITTKYESVATAFRAFQLGADAYLGHPVAGGDLLVTREGGPNPCTGPEAPAVMSLNRAVWEYINRKRVAAGTMTGAALRLGLDRRSLRRMLAKYPPAR